MPAPRRDDLFEWLAPPEVTPEGFWVGEGIVARSGAMHYVELDEQGNTVEFYEYVPDTTLYTYLPNLEDKPIVIIHPDDDQDVDPKNYRYLNVGHVGRIRFIQDPQDPSTLLAIAKLHIQDERGIKVLKQWDEVQLSPGYKANAIKEQGVTPQGVPYQTKQIARVHNHLALVEDARGGDRMKLRRDSAQMVNRRDNGGSFIQQPMANQQRQDMQQQPRQDAGIDYAAMGQAVVQAMIAAGFTPQQRQDMMPQRQDMQPVRQDMQPPRQDMAPYRQDMQQQPRQDMQQQQPRQDMQDDDKTRRDAMDAQIQERLGLLQEANSLGLSLDTKLDANALRRAIVEHQRPQTRRDSSDEYIRHTYQMLCEDREQHHAPSNNNFVPAQPQQGQVQQQGGWGMQNNVRRDHNNNHPQQPQEQPKGAFVRP